MTNPTHLERTIVAGIAYAAPSDSNGGPQGTEGAYEASELYRTCWCGRVYVQRAGIDPHHSHGAVR